MGTGPARQLYSTLGFIFLPWHPAKSPGGAHSHSRPAQACREERTEGVPHAHPTLCNSDQCPQGAGPPACSLSAPPSLGVPCRWPMPGSQLGVTHPTEGPRAQQAWKARDTLFLPATVCFCRMINRNQTARGKWQTEQRAGAPPRVGPQPNIYREGPGLEARLQEPAGLSPLLTTDGPFP